MELSLGTMNAIIIYGTYFAAILLSTVMVVRSRRFLPFYLALGIGAALVAPQMPALSWQVFALSTVLMGLPFLILSAIVVGFRSQQPICAIMTVSSLLLSISLFSLQS